MTTSVARQPLWPARVMPVGREQRIGRRSIRYVPPNIRDPRIHLSSVIATILFIGIGWLGFRVSIAQILVTMAACATVEIAITFRRTAILVWPASALQTATSTALLLRVIGTESGDYWTLHGWHLFVIVGVAGVLTKYTIRFSSGHVFNPSNVSLVLAFLILGSERVEPLDFWWGPLDLPMVAAYAVILVGGLVICGRLKLLGLGAALWISLAAGLAILAATDHSFTTRYSLTPITGAHFWWIIMTSPEIMIFMFFMITDPRTVPEGRVARIWYGTAIGLTSALFIAPWETEFGAKVGLLSGLVVICATRPLFDRHFPARDSADDDPLRAMRRLLAAPRLPSRAAAALGAAFVVIAVIAVAGLPARARSADAAPPIGPTSIVRLDPRTLPQIAIDPQVGGISADLATQDGARRLLVALDFNLQVEAEAITTGDASLLPAVADGARLRDLQALITNNGSGPREVTGYTFESIGLSIVYPGGFQRGPNIGVRATGTAERVTVTADGTALDRVEESFAMTFSMRVTTSGQWLNTIVLPYDVQRADG
jgi:hypothetical protein